MIYRHSARNKNMSDYDFRSVLTVSDDAVLDRVSYFVDSINIEYNIFMDRFLFKDIVKYVYDNITEDKIFFDFDGYASRFDTEDYHHKTALISKSVLTDDEGYLKEHFINKIRALLWSAKYPIKKDDVRFGFKFNQMTTMEEIARMYDESAKGNFDWVPFFDWGEQLLSGNQNFRVEVGILNESIVERELPIQYKYICPKCGNRFERIPYYLIPDDNKTVCKNIIDKKVCGKRQKFLTQVKKYLREYNLSISDKESVTIFSFDEIKSNHVKCSLIEIPIEGYGFKDCKQAYLCVDYEIMEKQKAGSKLLEKKEARDNNNRKDLVPGVIKNIDEMCENLSYPVYGMYDIKFLFLMNKIFCDMTDSSLDYKFKFKKEQVRNTNIFLVGDPQTGKSYICDIYNTIMFGKSHHYTDGSSVTYASLRGGTSNSGVVKEGLFGRYNAITIDEINDNKDGQLMAYMKSVLVENRYNNSTIDGDRKDKVKTAIMYLTENPNIVHINNYKNKIREEYQEIIKEGSLSGESESPERFNYDWDCHLPLYMYDWNPTLKKAIKNTRSYYENNDIDWITGHSISIMSRFPFTFFLSSEHGINMSDFADEENEVDLGDDSDEFTEHTQSFKMNMKRVKLFNNDMNRLVETYREFLGFPSLTRKYNEKLDSIMSKYGYENRDRERKAFYQILNTSRIINCRYKFNNVDFNRLERMLYMMNRKTYITEYVFDKFRDCYTGDVLEYRKKPSKNNIDAKGEVYGIDDDYNEEDDDYIQDKEEDKKTDTDGDVFSNLDE